MIEETTDETSCLELERRIALIDSLHDYAYYVIAPTMDCNAHCFYCYENFSKKRAYLDLQTEQAIIKYICNSITDKKSLHISWFGGEPLLCIDTIDRISEALIKYCKLKNIEYSAEITTNGYFLTNEIISNKLSMWKVDDVQITLDGDESEHIKRKAFQNGVDHWTRTMNAIYETSLKGIPVQLRLNVDKNNLKSVKNVMKDIISNDKWNDNISIYFAPLEPYSANLSSYYTVDEYESLMKELYSVLQELGYFKNREKYFPPQKLDLPCYSAMLNACAIDFAGNLYKCQHLMGNINFKIGTVDSGIVLKSDLLRWGDLDEQCVSCEVLPICKGGCIAKRKLGVSHYSCHINKYRLSILESIRRNQILQRENLLYEESQNEEN